MGSYEGVAARLDTSINRRESKNRPRMRPEIRAGIYPRHAFSTNAAKMATPETFSETGSETMYEKV